MNPSSPVTIAGASSAREWEKRKETTAAAVCVLLENDPTRFKRATKLPSPSGGYTLIGVNIVRTFIRHDRSRGGSVRIHQVRWCQGGGIGRVDRLMMVFYDKIPRRCLQGERLDL